MKLMRRTGAEVKVKVDKTLVASVALHVLVLGWGLVSFSSKAFDLMPEESVPVDVISADQLAKVMAGMKTGKKENPSRWWRRSPKPSPGRGRRRQDHREAAGRDRNRAAAAAEGRGKAGREKARSAEAGRRGQAEGRAEAGREEAGPQGRSDRGSHQEGREEAAAEAGPGRQAAGAEQAEDRARLRSVEDRRAARQARSHPPGRDRRHAEFQCRARPRPGQGRGQFRRPGVRCSSRRSSAAGRSPMAASRHRNPRPRSPSS